MSRFWPGDKGMESEQDEGASWEVLRSSCKVQPSPGDSPQLRGARLRALRPCGQLKPPLSQRGH